MLSHIGAREVEKKVRKESRKEKTDSTSVVTVTLKI